jgi:LysR family nod box-dependent transcriptional activator
MPAFLQRLQERAPGIQIEFKPQQNYPHLLLERGEADLLIAPTLFCSTHHPMETLLEDRLCCVVDADGPFSTGVMSEADFLSAGHIVMQPPNGGESFAQRAFNGLGIKLRIEVTTFFFASLPLLVRGSRRIGLVQRSLAQVLSKLGGVRIVEPPFPLPALQQSLQWHSYRTRDPALSWIREQLHETVRVIAEDRAAEGMDHVR